jgi:hypothetical protein
LIQTLSLSHIFQVLEDFAPLLRGASEGKGGKKASIRPSATSAPSRYPYSSISVEHVSVLVKINIELLKDMHQMFIKMFEVGRYCLSDVHARVLSHQAHPL